MNHLIYTSLIIALCLHGCSNSRESSGALNGESTWNELSAGFADPPHSAGVRCYWWWLNGNVDEEAITRDLEEMKDKGFNGALIFDADGSSQTGNRQVPAGPMFASPEWTRLFVHACREAKRLDLELSLNIQSGWNLGGPGVTAEKATQQLVWSKTVVEGPRTLQKKLELPVEPGNFYRDVAVMAVPVSETVVDHPIRDLDLKSATRELGGSAPDCRFLLNTEPALPGEVAVLRENIVDLSERMGEDETLRWDVPEGAWEVIRMGHTATKAHVSTSSGQWQGRVIDYMSPVALQDYWQRNIEPLMQAIGPMAGTTVRYLHTDSWEGGGMNWTPGFEETFRERRGYDPLPWLPVLAGRIIHSREESNAFLADLRKTIGELVAGHYAEFARLAGVYGMGIHPESAGPHAGPMDGLKNYSHSEIVMSEFWSPSPHRPTPDKRFFVKQASSAAHTYGKKLVSAEAFTTMGPHWNDIPWAHMKPSLDHELCEGLNLVVHCLFVCSPKEMGMPGQETWAGTHFNPQITWWEESKAFIDYERRCQYITQEGSFVADVVYYYGDHVPNIARQKDDDPAGALPGFDYDVLSEDLLVQALDVSEGTLTLPSGMQYRVLALPDHRILSLDVLQKVDELVRGGATVLGPKPHKAVSLVGGDRGRAEFKDLADQLWGREAAEKAGIRTVGQGRVAWGMGARELLRMDGLAPDVEFRGNDPHSGLRWIHYRIGKDDVYFVCNQKPRHEQATAIFRCGNKVPEFWDPSNGSVRTANTFALEEGRTSVPMEFGPKGSMFVVFRSPAKSSQNQGPNFPAWKERQVLSGPWQVSFDPAWGGPQEPVQFEALINWLDHEDSGVRHYSGKATYRTTFDLDEVAEDNALAIELGDVKDIGMASVLLNGVDLGVVWLPPFRVDVSGAIRQGANELEVTVVNSWRNRLIRDNALPEDQRLTKTNIVVVEEGRHKWHPEDSGLLGPVRIVEQTD